jgi:hypothetical protein
LAHSRKRHLTQITSSARPINIGGTSIPTDFMNAICQQTSGNDKWAAWVDCGLMVPGRQRDDEVAANVGRRIRQHE